MLNNLKVKQESEKIFDDVSIAIASAVTSCSRIFMSKTFFFYFDYYHNIHNYIY